MSLSQIATEKILGITSKTEMDARKMAANLVLTVFPYNPANVSKEVLAFYDILEKNLKCLGVQVIPYSESLQKISKLKVLKRFFKILGNNFLYFFLNILHVKHGYYHVHFGAIANLLKRDRIRKGISVIALGENEISKLPIDYTASFVGTSVITLLACPPNINAQSNFVAHFNEAMKIFSYHMTHLAILVSSTSWILYNFNASHPSFEIKEDMTEELLHSLIPKVAAPIKPPLLKEFITDTESFSINEEPFISLINDLREGGKKFNATGLYPKGKKVEDLPFRNGFYKWIGKIHLDHRSGMSYGFLAEQLPVKFSKLIQADEFFAQHNMPVPENDFFYLWDELYIIVEIVEGRFVLKVPEVWVLTQRSGSNKTNLDAQNDLLLLGLKNGQMHLRISQGASLKRDYRPSFDTKVILAHAVGNAIVASIMKHLSAENEFVRNLENKGLAMAHWHGYINPALIPNGWRMYGEKNHHVACSTAQSAVYAFQGKLQAFFSSKNDPSEYRGDIHIEPHHGTNITFDSISDLANFLVTTNSSELGNKYLVTK